MDLRCNFRNGFATAVPAEIDLVFCNLFRLSAAMFKNASRFLSIGSK